jgi:hypothetical protein
LTALSRRLATSQIALLVRAFTVSCFVVRTVERSSDRRLEPAPMPAVPSRPVYPDAVPAAYRWLCA